jgi:hypothetical protein
MAYRFVTRMIPANISGNKNIYRKIDAPRPLNAFPFVSCKQLPSHYTHVHRSSAAGACEGKRESDNQERLFLDCGVVAV